jgi:hypothetical protein
MDINRLSSAEITNLWVHYIRETMAICVSNYVLNSVKDREVINVFEFALQLSNNHIKILNKIFKQENFPNPYGFTDEDVKVNAPPLFSDNFWLTYIYGMSMHGSQLYSLAFNCSSRKDLRDFYYQCVNDSMNLYNMAIEVKISKGIYEKSPYFSTPKQAEYIKNFSYVMDVFGKQRPLNTIESGNLFFNLKKTNIQKGLMLGFSKVCQSDEIRRFMEKGMQVTTKHIGLFSSLLMENNLHVPKTLDSEVTDSTIAPFSDKLMLFHAGTLFNMAVSYYSYAAVTSLRADLIVHCETAIARDLKILAQFGQLMIKNHWQEEPPIADDRQRVNN